MHQNTYEAIGTNEMRDPNRHPQSRYSSCEVLTMSTMPKRRTVNLCGVEVLLPSNMYPCEIIFVMLATDSIFSAAVASFIKIGSFPRYSSDYVYAVLLLVNLAFLALYIFRGIFLQRPCEVVASLAGTLVVMVYCIADYAVFSEKRTPLKKERLARICIIGPLDIFCGIYIAMDYFRGPTWLLVKAAGGGNTRTQGFIRDCYRFSSFVTFDFQFVICLLVFLVTDGKMSLTDKLLIGLGVPFSFFWLLLGLYAVGQRSRDLSYIYLTLSLVEPAYIGYLMWKFIKNITASESRGGGLLQGELVTVDEALMAACCVGLVVRLGLVILTVKVMRNYKNAPVENGSSNTLAATS